MPTKQPLLGSLAIQAPSTDPQLVHVTPSTCFNLSLFKDLMKEYRKLDDSITMRLNRTNAQFRDRERLGAPGNIQEQACLYLFKELVENWKRRSSMIEYCVDVVDTSAAEKAKVTPLQEDNATAQRKTQAALYSDQVQRNQIRNELVVEKIVRQRALEAFQTRCKYFTPPVSEPDARKWWDLAQSRQ